MTTTNSRLNKQRGGVALLSLGTNPTSGAQTPTQSPFFLCFRRNVTDFRRRPPISLRSRIPQRIRGGVPDAVSRRPRDQRAELPELGHPRALVPLARGEAQGARGGGVEAALERAARGRVFPRIDHLLHRADVAEVGVSDLRPAGDMGGKGEVY